MPNKFRSKAQVRACYAKKDKNWNCKEFAGSQDLKNLPERSKQPVKRSRNRKG